jgi:hypothetical protein
MELVLARASVIINGRELQGLDMLVLASLVKLPEDNQRTIEKED